MNDTKKKRRGKIGIPCVGKPMLEGFPLPESVVLSEILRRLDLESLCTLACVCRALRSTVSQAIGALPSLDLSGFSVKGELFYQIIPRFKEVKTVTIDCLCLRSFDILGILKPCIQELSLLKCVSLSYSVLPLIGETCPNIRVLVLELVADSTPESLRRYLKEMLKSLSYLEDLSIEIFGTRSDAFYLSDVDLFLPRSVKYLKLHPDIEQHAVQFIEKLRCTNLLRLSLVLDVISDRLMLTITDSLPFLVELHLEDRRRSVPNMPHDLTNNGLQHLSSCHHLKHLSLVRIGALYSFLFNRVNDIGFLLLSQSCGRLLESVKLTGFSKVTDAGFSSLLRACPNLAKFEVGDSPLLSDLAFRDGVKCPLVELKLQHCNIITGEAIAQLASSNISLQVLDTNGCRRVSESFLGSSRLSTLTSLNLYKSNITNNGLLTLSKANLPLTNLSLRRCMSITDLGISNLFDDGPRRINKTLSSLDISQIPWISDQAIKSIVSNAEAISELCISCCSRLTDVTFLALGKGRIQKLDVSRCNFSDAMAELWRSPSPDFFRGLRWLGIRDTCLAKAGEFGYALGLRPWLTLCFHGCCMGCCDGWYLHKIRAVDMKGAY